MDGSEQDTKHPSRAKYLGGMETHQDISSAVCTGGDASLFLLMTVLTQALFALVSSNLMAFTLFTARHNVVCFKKLLK